MIGIIGGGISGLAVARRLYELDKPFFLLEADEEVGGVIKTVRPTPSWQLNYGANTVFVDEPTMEFLERAGLGPDWVEPAPVGKARYILQNKKYEKMPASPPALLLSGFFSLGAKIRILKELGYKGLGAENETVYDFFARHFGEEVADKAVQPFVGGIYAGDAKELLMKLTFPAMLDMERQHGSILRGFIKANAGKRRRSISFLEGMSQLPNALAVMARHVYAGRIVTAIQKAKAGYHLQTQKGDSFECDELVMAVPSYIASKLLRHIDEDVANQLGKVYYPSLAQIHLGFKESDIGVSLKGFGGLHPPAEGMFTSGAIWVSSVFPMRAPMGCTLMCVFAGGAGRTDITHMADKEVLAKSVAEIRSVYKISSEPEMAHMRRWEHAIPQYDKNLLGLEESVQRLEKEDIYFNTNYIGGVSVADCIKKGMALAERF